jgi:hypothetical protein
MEIVSLGYIYENYFIKNQNEKSTRLFDPKVWPGLDLMTSSATPAG